jgi:hypothetical protein
MENIMHTLLIDGDILVYKIAHSVETPIYVVKNGIYATKSTAEKASKRTGFPINKRINIGTEKELRSKLNLCLKQIFDDMNCHNSKLFITTNAQIPNFRTKLATIQPYKLNRLKKAKPIHYKRIREILVTDYKAIQVEGMETDDQLAIEQTASFHLNHGDYSHCTIVSIDKDLRTVPGMHYNINSRVLDFVSKDQALANFMKQLLTGDTTDDIPGLFQLLKLNNRMDEANHLSHNKYIKKMETDTVDLAPMQCYNYIYELYKRYGFENYIPEIFNLLWLKRYNTQNGYRDFIEGRSL